MEEKEEKPNTAKARIIDRNVPEGIEHRVRAQSFKKS